MAKFNKDQITYNQASSGRNSVQVFLHSGENQFVHVLDDGELLCVPIDRYVRLLHPADCRCQFRVRKEFVERTRQILDWTFWIVKVGLFIYSLYAGFAMAALQIVG